MELKKNFTEFLAESKDTQKDKENSELQAKDASHGDKADTIKEADAQKDKENAELQAKDASHGDKPETIKEDDDMDDGDDEKKNDDGEEEVLDESVIAGTIRCLVRHSSGNVEAIATLSDDKNIEKLLKYAKLPVDAKDTILQGKEYKHGNASYSFDDIKEF